MALCTSRERRDALSLVGASARCSASLAVFFGLRNTALHAASVLASALLAACKTLARRRMRTARFLLLSLGRQLVAYDDHPYLSWK